MFCNSFGVQDLFTYIISMVYVVYNNDNTYNTILSFVKDIIIIIVYFLLPKKNTKTRFSINKALSKKPTK